jgi:hypothetical protein
MDKSSPFHAAAAVGARSMLISTSSARSAHRVCDQAAPFGPLEELDFGGAKMRRAA